jgi:hypothetical protein
VKLRRRDGFVEQRSELGQDGLEIRLRVAVELGVTEIDVQKGEVVRKRIRLRDRRRQGRQARVERLDRGVVRCPRQVELRLRPTGRSLGQGKKQLAL